MPRAHVEQMRPNLLLGLAFRRGGKVSNCERLQYFAKSRPAKRASTASQFGIGTGLLLTLTSMTMGILSLDRSQLQVCHPGNSSVPCSGFQLPHKFLLKPAGSSVTVSNGRPWRCQSTRPVPEYFKGFWRRQRHRK